MKRMILILILTPLYVLGLVSCSEFGASYHIFQGNYYFLQGDYQRANIKYLRVAEEGIEKDIVSYNLGTVYNALGETESAAVQWEEITTDDDLLAFRLSYNKGVLFYQAGEYQAAFDSFRQALLYDSSSREARINLEHSFRKLNIQEEVTSGTDSEARQAESGDEDIQRVLEYIRRNEPVHPPREEEQGTGRRDRDW